MFALGLGQKPVVMPRYPHMLSEDTDVWTRYLAAPVAPIKELWYDVLVGRPFERAVYASAADKRLAAGVGCKRIDVVCRVGGGFWVVEIKPFASYTALGQVLTYTRLFRNEYRPDGEVWSVIVCDVVDLDLLDDFDAAGVAVIVVD